jgi:hypothetical protein
MSAFSPGPDHGPILYPFWWFLLREKGFPPVPFFPLFPTPLLPAPTWLVLEEWKGTKQQRPLGF